MGNPSSGCAAVQMPMSVSKRRHRQSLSLQLEQLGQLGSSNLCESKKSASALSSPKVTEEKSIASFLGSKQFTRRPSSSLCGTEEYLKGIELHGGASSDRKPSSFIPFRGHRRVGSGSTVTPCKSLESSFRKEKNSESPRERGGSLSFRKDRSAVAKIAASLFHSPTKIERSMSMSRVAQKAMQAEEVVSLRQQFQTSTDDGSQPPASCESKESGLHISAQEIEAQPLILSASSLQHECVIDSSNLVKDDGGEEQLPSTITNDPSLCTADPLLLLPDHNSQEFVNAPETEPGNVRRSSLRGSSFSELQQISCSELNSYSWTKTKEPILPSSTAKRMCSSLEINSTGCADATSEATLSPTVGSSSVGSLSSRMETDSAEENVGAKIHAVDDLPSLLFASDKVTEEELTEAAVRSSLMSEDYLNGTHFFSSEDSQENLLKSEGRTHAASPDLSIETGLMMTCDSDASLTKCMSFELVARDKSKADAEVDRKSRVRKRRRSLSASGIGAILLKVVRVSDSGPVLTRRLPKVGPDVISGADALRAREYVLQKTAQISMSPSLESSSPVSAPAACQCESKDVVKSTSSKCEPDSKGDVAELEQYPKVDLEGVKCTGCSVDDTCETRQQNQQTTPEMVPRNLPNLADTNSGNACTQEEMAPAVVEVEGCFQERVERVDSNLQRTTPDDKSESQNNAPLNGSANTPAVANADERRGGVSRKKSSSRGRNSYDSDSLTDGPKTARSNSGIGRSSNKQAALSVMDANVAISRERSRSFISRLQAPSGISSVDVFHLAPSSISILANPSFSSSHQDRLWEEQAEAYSSGGRGTPGREDEAAPVANLFLHSPSPGIAISSDDLQVPSASASLRRGLIDSSAGSFFIEKGRHKRKGQSKKKGRPHTPLRSLLADDVHSKSSAGSASRPSPEGGHFIHQIMSRIKGSSSSKSLSPKSPDHVSRRRTIWNSCICFSVK